MILQSIFFIFFNKIILTTTDKRFNIELMAHKRRQMQLFRKQKISLLILLGLLVIGGGVFLILRLSNLNMSAFRPPPDTILNQVSATYKNSQDQQVTKWSNWVMVKLATPTPTPPPMD